MSNRHIIPNVEQIRLCERFTMEQLKISSLQLMERAGVALAQKIAAIIKDGNFRQVHIFCGCGNNGGDGLVIARILRTSFTENTLGVHVVLCQSDTPRYSQELKANLQRWEDLLENDYSNYTYTSFGIFKPGDDIQVEQDGLIIDALFGIGLNKPVGGVYAEVIRKINVSEAYTVAVDIPSGLFADVHTPPSESIVLADKTLSVQFPKLAFMLPEQYPIYGDVDIVDIGMQAPPNVEGKMAYLTASEVANLLHPIHPYGHKGTFGHGLLIAGCADMPGAAILSATAALRGGIGKLTVHTAGKVAQVVPICLPEAVLHRDANDIVISSIRWDTQPPYFNAVAIGPGIGTANVTVIALKNFLDEVQTPIILDADALNILAENKTWLAFLPPYSILTPHLKEFERLVGPVDNDFHRIQLAREFAQRYQVILVLKGHHTIISLPDGMQFFNTTGNVCLATAGSGDTLTGLLLALMAQGYNPVETALIGVFVHGAAADLYRNEGYERGMLASDLPLLFGKVLRKLQTEFTTNKFNKIQ